VTWSLEPGKKNGERRLRVDWRESGAPLVGAGRAADANVIDEVPVAPRQGYGRELIERALPFQLRAQVSYELAPEGVRCNISVPVSTTLDVAFSNEGDAGEANA
jgi:two-component sensor histidine kinase